VQDFIVQHRESHDQYPDDASGSAARLRVDMPRSQPGCDCSICNQQDAPMSDLRTRIAEAIKRVDCYPSNDDNPYPEMADAVIRELGLWQQLSNWHPGYYRYVTEWETDDD